MRLNQYSIFDMATGAYMRPFFMQSDGQAMRAFKDLCMDANHEVGKHPEDYSLVRSGVWDDQTAQTQPEDTLVLANGLEVVAQSRKVNGDQLDGFDQSIVDNPGVE